MHAGQSTKLRLQNERTAGTSTKAIPQFLDNQEGQQFEE